MTQSGARRVSTEGRAGGGLALSQGSLWEDQLDARFKELLRPIKDLTENWEVPLSRYLEDYMVELSDLRINLEGRTAHVNFAEAALLLQGTASVYSKKVEFLWQNVLEMLDLLASQKALEQASGAEESGSKGKRSRRGAQHAFNDFSLVSAELGRNTHLKTDEFGVEKFRERKATLNFITVTPRQLIEKEGKEQKVVRVNLHTKNHRDLLGQKEDYRINAQFTLDTAMLGEDLTAGIYLAQHSVSLFDETSGLESSWLLPLPGLAQAVGPLSPEPISPPATPPATFDEIEADCPSSPVSDRLSPDMPSSPIVQHSTLRSTLPAELTSLGQEPELSPVDDDDDLSNSQPSQKKRRDRFQENLDETKAPLEMPWEPINPAECIVVAKPQKRPRTAPKRRDMRIEDEPVKRQPGWRSQKINRASRGNLVKVTVPQAEFTIHDWVGPSPATINPSNPLGGTSMASGEPAGDSGQSGAEDEEDSDGLMVQTGSAPEDDWDPPGRMPDSPALPIPTSASLAMSSESGTVFDENVDSYEELVMKRVAAYVQQSQEYILSTDLAQRVSQWHDQIRPRLESVEKRGNFDIHAYGSTILSTFPEGNAKTTVSFRAVVENQDQEEVCRYFLSSLMLANTYNIDLSPSTKAGQSTESDGAVPGPMDDVQLTLLSTVRHHEAILDDMAPSGATQGPVTSSQRSLGQKSRRPPQSWVDE